MRYRLPKPRGNSPFAGGLPRDDAPRIASRPPRTAAARSRTRAFVWFVLVGGLLSALALVIYGVTRGGAGGVLPAPDPHAAWNKLAAELQAAGEPVEFVELAPGPVPDAENFFADPVFAGLADGAPTHPLLQRALEPGKGLSVRDLLNKATQGGGGASLEAIAQTMLDAGLVKAKTDFLLAGDRVRAGFRGLGLDFAPLLAAADRPAAAFPTDYARAFPPRPHLPALEALGDWLAIRAMAEISTGDSEAAALNLMLITRLAGALAPEPFVASQAARARLLGLFAGCVRVGIGWGAWSDEQLATFAEAADRERILPDMLRALRGERAQLNTAIALALAGRKPEASAPLQAWLGPDLLQLDVPTLRRRQVAINRAMQEFLTPLTAADGAHPPALGEATVKTLPEAAREHFVTLGEDVRLAAQVQTYLAQAAAACALQRHRLARGSYPEDLAGVAPEFLPAPPVDPMTAKPLAYARTDRGFTLTGAGWSDGKAWVWEF